MFAFLTGLTCIVFFMNFSKSFRNELGNAIEVCVSRRDGKPSEIVDIRIVGPHSESQNIITLQEALVLQEALNSVLPLLKKDNNKVTTPKAAKIRKQERAKKKRKTKTK